MPSTHATPSWSQSSCLPDNLPDDVCARLGDVLRLTELIVGKVINEANAQQCNMYFPRSRIISLRYGTQDGPTGATAMVGNEGLIGSALLVDGHNTPDRAVVQIEGEALVLKADAV